MTSESSTGRVLRRQQSRLLKDRLAAFVIAIGGISIVAAIVLIFIYLASIVAPLFVPAKAEKVAGYGYPANGAASRYLAVDEQGDVAFSLAPDGRTGYFFGADDAGQMLLKVPLPIPEGVAVNAVAEASPATHLVALGLSDGRALVIRHVYQETYPDGARVIVPAVEYPFGEAPLLLNPAGEPIRRLAVEQSDEATTLVATSLANGVHILRLTASESLLGDDEDLEYEQSRAELPLPTGDLRSLLIDRLQETLYLLDKTGRARRYGIRDLDAPELVEERSLTPSGVSVAQARMLLGGFSLLIGGSDGVIYQWFPVRDGSGKAPLHLIRSFDDLQGKQLVALAAEQRSKGFAAAAATGEVIFSNTTAHRTSLRLQLASEVSGPIAIAPRGDHLLAGLRDGLSYWQVDNPHPDISWSAVWDRVWYEGYDEPEYQWQSSASTSDFEPKFSLTPLTFGTLKAAFYAMLFATPLALLGAIYTGYFMTPAMRGSVKPLVEMMGALPTVILGFLAGLWLAPTLELYMPGFIALLLLLPPGVLLASYAFSRLPRRLRTLVPTGWEAALLMPVILAIGWLAISLNHPLESLFFGGDFVAWLTNDLGIPFDQRNSVVVGIAMGVAVIPNIFTIAEDAVFSVPKHLTQGSLALGATTWQTLVRVVLLTASPGIFSALMIGLGRAVGETMIVLMATGNTAIMDFSIFQGMRTLAANIAVEMPEAEVASTHYRVLFLAAIVLFALTFVANTVAELVRQRLREKYSSL